MFSRIYLDYFLDLRIPQLVDFFEFSGFASNLKLRTETSINPSLSGGGKINSPFWKKILIRKKCFTRFLKIPDKFKNSFIRS